VKVVGIFDILFIFFLVHNDSQDCELNLKTPKKQQCQHQYKQVLNECLGKRYWSDKMRQLAISGTNLVKKIDVAKCRTQQTSCADTINAWHHATTRVLKGRIYCPEIQKDSTITTT